MPIEQLAGKGPLPQADREKEKGLKEKEGETKSGDAAMDAVLDSWLGGIKWKSINE